MGFWDKYGGKEAYVSSQQQRYKEAIARGDTALANRIKADAARVGYSLPSSSTSSPSRPSTSSSSSSRPSTSSSSSSSYWNQYGGYDAYVKSQQQRYAQAVQSGNTDLIRRLQADAARVGYSLPSTSSPSDYWSRYTGGREGYIQSQQERYRQAAASGDWDLLERLNADALRVGYSLPESVPYKESGGILKRTPQGHLYIRNPQEPTYTEYIKRSQITPEQLTNMIGEQFREVFYPYQQVLEGLYQSRPQYTPRSWEQLLEQARAYANLQIDPQVSAIQRALEQQRQAAETARQQVEAAYASVPERTQRLMEEAQRKAIESAIARGGGRSGAVEWLTKELQTPIVERQQQLEAERAAALADIANQLSLAEKQATERLQELEQLRGQYAEQQAKALEELEYARATGDWERAFQAAQQLSSMASSAAQWASQMALSFAPYVMPTWGQVEDVMRGIAETLGQVPGGINISQAPQPVPVRTYVTTRYGSQYVDYDPVTKELIIGGKRIPISGLSSYGGYLDTRTGTAYLPPKTIEDFIWGRL